MDGSQNGKCGETNTMEEQTTARRFAYAYTKDELIERNIILGMIAHLKEMMNDGVEKCRERRKWNSRRRLLRDFCMTLVCESRIEPGKRYFKLNHIGFIYVPITSNTSYIGTNSTSAPC